MRRRLAFVLVAAALMGCDAISMIDRPMEGLYPGSCAEWDFPERQCEAIVDEAVRVSGVDPNDVAELWLLPFEREITFGGGQIALVGIELADGKVVEGKITCAGLAIGPVCNPEAEIRVVAGIDRDVPCSGEAPLGCATLPPTPPPEAVAEATPLRVATLEIPIDHAGRYEVAVGKATLANGNLEERSMWLANARPDEFWIDEGVRLDVRPDDPARPTVGSVYREPFDGSEPVTVFVVFEVTDFDEPATLQLRDIVVR